MESSSQRPHLSLQLLSGTERRIPVELRDDLWIVAKTKRVHTAMIGVDCQRRA